MRQRSVQKVPAGKRPKIKKTTDYKSIYKPIIAWFKAKKVRSLYFLAFTALLILSLLGLHNHLQNYIYIVKVNDQEVGIVDNAKEVENFIAHLTDRCGSLYGMSMEPAAEILLIKEFRPGAKPTPDQVQEKIRQELTFVTDAYLITVDGEPFVAVRNEEDLDQVISKLKNVYTTNGYGARTIETQIKEELEIEPFTADPDMLLEPDEVITLLTGLQPQSEQIALLPRSVDFLVEGTGNTPGSNDLPFSILFIPEKPAETVELPVINDQEIHIKTVEEVTVRETIPFEVEYVYDEDLWVVQKDITVQGEEGRKEVIYYITRENGLEIDRLKIGETIISEPVTQVVTVGTTKVPAVGTGRFVWPVEDGGEITPGRGFSTWHTGIDIHAHTGTNVLAADSGVVWFSGYGGPQGNYLIIYHGSFWTLYLHNSENLVREGASVQQGDVIARVGSTGRSSGPHLHFEVRLDDGSGEWHTYYQHTPIDPLQFFRP